MRRRGLHRSSKSIVVDTSVFAEHVNASSPYRSKLNELFETSRSKVALFIPTVTLSETLYVLSRIYKLAGRPSPNSDALNYINWIKSRATTVGDEGLAISAGELKKELKLALPDCYVIATAEKLNGIALFAKLEEEMKGGEKTLRKLRVSFVEEFVL